MKLGEYIKYLRVKKGFSQRQLGMYAKISNTEISKIESGERNNPSPKTLEKLAPFLEVSYEKLLIAAGYLDSDKLEDNGQSAINDALEDYRKKEVMADEIIEFLIEKGIIHEGEELDEEKLEWIKKLLDKAIDMSRM